MNYSVIMNSLKYDPFGRRIYKSSSSGTSIYAYDGDNLMEETNSSGTAVARYSQGLNIDEPLAMLRSSATSYYDADGLGSITSLGNAAGTLAQTYTFDSFGKQTASSGSLTNPFQYTAREFDPETSLYYYRARYYDQTTGRFVEEDPIGILGGINLYGYVFNNPLGWVDPSGLNTTVFILYDHGIGSHAAVLVDNGGDPVLYDPAGGYSQDHHCNEICNEGSADPNKYKKYHNDRGTDVKVFIFNTTPDQEKQIVQNILDAGSSAPGMCTLGVSGVLSGVGPFKNLGHYLLPGSLGRALGNLQNPPPPYRPGGHFK